MKWFFFWIANLLDPPALVCAVRFAAGGPYYDVNEFIGMPPLCCAASTVPGQNASPAVGQLSAFPGDGLRFEITRPPGTPDGTAVLLLCNIWPMTSPPLRFRMAATFELTDGFGLTQTDDLWAAVVVARNGVRDDLTGFTPVGATQQVRSGDIALGAALATGAQPSPAQSVMPRAQAYPGGRGRNFELETTIDCYTGKGVSLLRTPGHAFPASKWMHPYVYQPGSSEGSGIKTVGIGIAIARGEGTAAVTARTMMLYSWSGPKPWWRRLIAAVIDEG